MANDTLDATIVLDLNDDKVIKGADDAVKALNKIGKANTKNPEVTELEQELQDLKKEAISTFETIKVASKVDIPTEQYKNLQQQLKLAKETAIATQKNRDKEYKEFEYYSKKTGKLAEQAAERHFTDYFTFDEDAKKAYANIESIENKIHDLVVNGENLQQAYDLSKVQKELSSLDITTDRLNYKIALLTDTCKQLGVTLSNAADETGEELLSDTVAKTDSAANDLKQTLGEVSDSLNQADNGASALNDTLAKTDASQINSAVSQVGETLQNANQQTIDLKANVSEMNIAELLRYIDEVKTRLKEIGTPAPEQDAEFIQLTNQLIRAQRAVSDYKRNLDKTIATEERAAETKKRMTSVGQRLVGVLTNLKINFKSTKSATQDAIKHIKTLGAQSKVFTKLQRNIENLSHTLKRNFKHHFTNLVKYVLGFRSLFFLVRRMRRFIREGIENLARYNDTVNKGVKSHNLVNDQINELQTSLLYLKNAWAAAFSPILIKVIPILTGLIDYLAVAGNAIARFVAKLTGQENAYNALKVQAQDYADSLDNTGSSASDAADNQKKLNQTLAEYDKLLVIAQKKDTDSSPDNGGGSGADIYTPNPQDMFTVVDSEDSLAKALLDAFTEGGWAALGDTVSDTIAGAFNQIPWEDIQTNVEGKLGAVGEFINGLLGNDTLWTSFGKTAGNALNTVTKGIKALIDPIDTFNIGWNAAGGLHEFLTTVDWKTLGVTINTAWTKITDGVKGFLDNFPTEDAANAIVDFIDGLDLPQLVSTTFTIAIEGLIKVVEIATNVVVKGADRLSEKLVASVSVAKVDKYTKIEDDGSVHTVELNIEPDIDWTEHPLLALLDSGLTNLGSFAVNIITNGDIDKLMTLIEWFDVNEGKNRDNAVRWADILEKIHPVLQTISLLVGNPVTLFTGIFDGVDFTQAKQVLDTINEIFAFLGNPYALFEHFFGDVDFNDGEQLVQRIQSVMLLLGQPMALIDWQSIFSGGFAKLKTWWNSTFLADWFGEMQDNGSLKKKSGGASAIGFGSAMSIDYSGFIPPNNVFSKINEIKSTLESVFKDPLGSIKTSLFDEKKGLMKYFTGDNSIVKKIKHKLGLDDDTIGIVGALKKAFTSPLASVKTALFSENTGLMQYFSGNNSIIKKIKDKLNDSGISNAFKKAFNFDAIFEQRIVSSKLKDSQKTLWEKLFGYKVGSKHINGLLDDLKDKFVSIWTGIKTGIKSPIRAILEMIENVINACIGGINWLLKKAGSITIAGKPILPSNWTNPLPDFTIDYKAIGLAQGAVIPPNKEFLAVLGDQKQGVNIETPLNTMIDAFKTALAEGGGNTNHAPIVLQLEGRTVAQVVWDEEDKKYKQTGFGLAY